MARADTDDRAQPNRRHDAGREFAPQRSEGLIDQSGQRPAPPSAAEPPPVARHASGSDAWQETSAAPDTVGVGSTSRRYEDVRRGFAADFAAHRPASGARARTFAQAEPNYRAGFDAGVDLRYEGQPFEAIEAALRHEYKTSAREAPTERRAPDDDGTWEQICAEIRCGFDAARAG